MTAAGKPLILLIEPQLGGHHGMYVRWLIRDGIPRGYRFHLATAEENTAHPLYQALLEEGGRNLEISFFNRRADTPVRPQKGGQECPPSEIHQSVFHKAVGLAALDFRWRGMCKQAYLSACRKNTPAFVLLPYLDYCLYSLALLGSPFGPTPWGGIAMRPAFHLAQTPYSRIKKWLFFRLLKNPTLASLFLIDELLHASIRKDQSVQAAKCHYLPDPAELRAVPSKQAARTALGIPDDAVAILVYGAISLRKGFDILLAALREPGLPSRVQVILAGQQDAEAKAVCATAAAQALVQAGRLHILDTFLSDAEEARVFAATDLLWMGYRRHCNASGVMVQGGQQGLPILGCAEGLIGWAIAKHQLGITLPLDDPRQTAQAIRDFINHPTRLRQCAENGRRAFAAHTPDHFAAQLFQHLPPAPFRFDST